MSTSAPSLPLRRAAAAVAVALTLIGVPAVAAISDAQFQPVFQQYMNADSAGKIEAANEKFRELFKADPTNPVLMAYVGATEAQKANGTWMPWKKMSHSEDGMALIDKALALLGPEHDQPLLNHTPGSLETRFVAANVFLAVPEFMNRRERGNRLMQEIVNHPTFASAPLGFKDRVWLLGVKTALKQKQDDAAKAYVAAMQQARAPHLADAQALLAGAK